jgi:phage tail-like protein
MVSMRAGVSLRFDVQIDGVPVASFTSCSGLGAQYEVVSWREGGDNGTTAALPGRLSYNVVRLTRVVDDQSGALAAWFAAQFRMPQRLTAVIKLYDGNVDASAPIAVWTLDRAWPVRYTGPTLSTTAQGESMAIETLELMHQGFLP